MKIKTAQKAWVMASVALALSISTVQFYPAFGAPAVNQTISIQPKPLTPSVLKGIDYLVKLQLPDGGWSEGEESQYMHSVGKINQTTANVADTCMTALALVRSGNYPNSGKYATNVKKAGEFVCGSIEKSDDKSLFVTDIRGTRVQSKLGQYVDTFLASLFLSEIKGHMGDAAGNKRVEAALNKVIAKIEKNQGADGQLATDGWAPIHSQALAAKGLNRAKQVGLPVPSLVLSRAQTYAAKSFDRKTGSFSSAGSAGVNLYAAGATSGTINEIVQTNKKLRPEMEKLAQTESAPAEQRAMARAELKRFDEAEALQKDTMTAMIGKLEDKSFVSGFGCNGGEEFLSYLHISESLLGTNNGKEWDKWDAHITKNINHVQNTDGSWMGHHCITSRTFCTAAALLVLMADRAPSNAAVGAKIGNGNM